MEQLLLSIMMIPLIHQIKKIIKKKKKVIQMMMKKKKKMAKIEEREEVKISKVLKK